MKTETLQELITLCKESLCNISLECSDVGIVVEIKFKKNWVLRQAGVYLDRNDTLIGNKLLQLIEKVTQ